MALADFVDSSGDSWQDRMTTDWTRQLDLSVRALLTKADFDARAQTLVTKADFDARAQTLITKADFEARVQTLVTKVDFEARVQTLVTRGEFTDFRLELKDEFIQLRKEMANQRVELLRWSFLFWIGQVAATAGLISLSLRFAR